MGWTCQGVEGQLPEPHRRYFDLLRLDRLPRSVHGSLQNIDHRRMDQDHTWKEHSWVRKLFSCVGFGKSSQNETVEHRRSAIGLIFPLKWYHNIQVAQMAIMHWPPRPGKQVDQEDVNLPKTKRYQTFRPQLPAYTIKRYPIRPTRPAIKRRLVTRPRPEPHPLEANLPERHISVHQTRWPGHLIFKLILVLHHHKVP